ncbi:tetratricopeptide repeat protein [Elusimicrobiota bacterium]
MRRWVREELKKNPIAVFVIQAIVYVKNNRQNLMVTLVGIVVIGLFAGVIIKNKINENREAGRIFAFIQNDFYSFNYKKAIDKIKDVENKFGSAKIMDHVIYLKALAYYRMGKTEEAIKILEECINSYQKSKVIDNMRLVLATMMEETSKYDKAFLEYDKIGENSYLKPEALSGQARIAELQGDTKKAINIYKVIQSHYVNSYWGNFAKTRLLLFGVNPIEAQEFIPKMGK